MIKKGFTLIELVIVVAIIGLLAAAVAVGFGRQQAKSRDARRIADIKTAQTAIESYISEKGDLPASASEICAWDVSSMPTGSPDFMSFLITSGYLQKNLTDPTNEVPINSNCEGARSYYYRYSGNYYDLKANLETGSQSTSFHVAVK